MSLHFYFSQNAESPEYHKMLQLYNEFSLPNDSVALPPLQSKVGFIIFDTSML